MMYIKTSYISPQQALIRERLFSDPISLAMWNCAATRTTGEMNQNDKIVCWQGFGEAGTLNFAGGTINRKKKVFKSNFAINDKS